MRKRWAIAALVCVLALALGAAALRLLAGQETWGRAADLERPQQGGVLILQQGQARYSGTVDTFIASTSLDRAYGRADELILNGKGAYAGLIRFQLSFLSATTPVSQASLVFHVLTCDEPVTLTLYAALRPWLPDEATWIQASAREPWELPGAALLGVDRGSRPIAVAHVAEAGESVSFDITELARRWLVSPVSNQGVIVVASGPAMGSLVVASADHRHRGKRPTLKLDMSLPGSALSAANSGAVVGVLEANGVATVVSPSPVESTPTKTPTAPVIAERWLRQGEGQYRGVADSYVSAWHPETNYGHSDVLHLVGDGAKRALVKFDLSALSGIERVDQAELGLFPLEYGQDLRVWVCAAEEPWLPDQVIWRGPLLNARWHGIPGCDPEVDAVVMGMDPDGWLRADVSQWVARWRDGSLPNNGFWIMAQGTVDGRARVASSEYWQLAFRPYLRVLER